jgi:nicotinate-nucleotide--dimethylbenzimidazole phosphoribosyltransferase
LLGRGAQGDWSPSQETCLEQVKVFSWKSIGDDGKIPTACIAVGICLFSRNIRRFPMHNQSATPFSQPSAIDWTAAADEQLAEILQQLVLQIAPLDRESAAGMQARMDAKIKPIRSLGVLEDLAVQVAGVQRTTRPRITGKAILLMAGDHGVVAEGVSAAPQEITAQMFYSYLAGGAGINVLARCAGAELICSDIGIAGPLDPPELMRRRVRNGTANLAVGPAMSRRQALQAILTGAQIAGEAIDRGVNLLATGEVGIGNTTPSAALVTVFTGQSIDEVAGRGTGLKPEAFQHKKDVIRQAIAINQPDPADPVGTLAKVGGLEIAALTGAILKAASRGVPVILDGIISIAAALPAVQLAPAVVDCLIASHNSEEKGHEIGLRKIGLKPRLELNMRLGEGTGAALMFPIVEAALKVADEMATFDAAGVTTGDF